MVSIQLKKSLSASAGAKSRQVRSRTGFRINDKMRMLWCRRIPNILNDMRNSVIDDCFSDCLVGLFLRAWFLIFQVSADLAHSDLQAMGDKFSRLLMYQQFETVLCWIWFKVIQWLWSTCHLLMSIFIIVLQRIHMLGIFLCSACLDLVALLSQL